MSTPIGSIEFLVKFDTMADSFKDALKDALKSTDLDLDSSDITDIKNSVEWIRWNVATRLRTPFTGDYAQAAVAARHVAARPSRHRPGGAGLPAPATLAEIDLHR